MFRYAIIQGGKLHEILEREETLEVLRRVYYAPTITLIDITCMDPAPQEGWDYDDVTGQVSPPAGPTPAEAAAAKMVAIDRAAAAAYVGGFYSSATGVPLWYDSDEETQRLLEGLGRRTMLPDWATLVRYPGMMPPCPADSAPIRARPTAESPAADKAVEYLTGEQINVLIADLDTHLFAVKSHIWAQQMTVYLALATGATAAEIEALPAW